MLTEKLINFERVIPISAKECTRIGDVKKAIREVLDQEAEKNIKPAEGVESKSNNSVISEQLKIKIA